MEALTTVDKAVDVLFHLHREPAGQGVTSIGRALGLPKSSAHRLLAALSRRGLVEQDGRGRYRPGIGLIALGLGALDREPAVVAARPILEAEAAAIGETVFLVAARAGRLIVLDKVEGSGFLRAAPQIGSTVPAHATAVGKLYLAFGEGAIESPDGALEPFTDRTLCDEAALARAVARVAEQGHASNRDEWVLGLSVVAAPVFAAAGALAAAIAIATPTPRLELLGADTLAERAVAAARRVSNRLAGETT
jgi:DNA-binding IclR family transcriptional regulator